MDQLRKLIAALSVRQRIGIIVTALLVIGSVASFVHWRHESDFRPLFTGMSADDAAAIVQKLKEAGMEHRLAENGSTVLVPAAKVDELRLEMAAAGLPRTGRIGFEIFDKSNIGISDFAERVNYRRALEGELERSIKVLTEVERARVHITFPKDSVFLDAREPAKASVLLTLKPEARLSDQNILAITNLVASAAEGLSPEFVSVVDMKGNLLSRPKRAGPDAAENSDASLEYRQRVEKDLMAKVESTLEPLLGDGKFRVGLSVDCDLATSEQTDEIFDPSRSVMVTSQKSEDVAGSAQSAGVPGTASNLPRPLARPVLPGSAVSRRTENAAYETSRTVRQTKIPRGTIKRISASLLVAQEVRWERQAGQVKRIAIPASADKLKAIHDIVAGVIGLDPQRGDQLVIESLPFEEDLDTGPVPDGPQRPGATATWRQTLMECRPILLGVGISAVVGISVIAFTVRRRYGSVAGRGRRESVALTDSSASLPAGNDIEELSDANPGIEQVLNKIQLPPIANDMEAYRKQLRETVNKDPLVAATVIRDWLAEDAG